MGNLKLTKKDLQKVGVSRWEQKHKWHSRISLALLLIAALVAVPMAMFTDTIEGTYVSQLGDVVEISGSDVELNGFKMAEDDTLDFPWPILGAALGFFTAFSIHFVIMWRKSNSYRNKFVEEMMGVPKEIEGEIDGGPKEDS